VVLSLAKKVHSIFSTVHFGTVQPVMEAAVEQVAPFTPNQP
jgi:hypothetical protein